MMRGKKGRAVPALVIFACLISSGSLFAQEKNPVSDSSVSDQPAEIPPEFLTFQKQMADAQGFIVQRQFNEAESALRDIIKDNPDIMEPHFMLATVLIQKSNYQEATTILDQLLEKHGDDATLMNNYAWLLATATDYTFRDPKRALALARDALFLNPNDYHIWSTLAEAHYVNGNFEKAVQAMEKGLELAIRLKVSDDTILRYRTQFRKLQDINTSMSIIE